MSTTHSHTTHDPRWRRLPEERPQQILDAALSVFAEHGIDAAKLEDVQIFHAGTKRAGGEVKTVGGRVLAVTGVAPTLEQARERAYAAGASSWLGRDWVTAPPAASIALSAEAEAEWTLS